MKKVTNIGNDIRRVLNGGAWVYLKPKQSVVVKNVSEDVLNHHRLKVEDVEESDKKTKKTKGDE